jgi:hypothetical protein
MRSATRTSGSADVSSFVRVDHPDDVIHWFASYPESERTRPPLGPCTHECEHRQSATVGWGPDLKHYELIVCEESDGCNGNCRAWLPTDDNAHGGTGGPTYRRAVFNPDMRLLASGAT